MTTDRLLRWAGVIGVFAAFLTISSQLLGLYAIDPLNLPATVSSPSAMIFGLTKLSAVILLLLALVGVYVKQALQAGVLGVIAFIAAMIGTALVAGDFWYEGLVVPWLATVAPQILVEAASGQQVAFRSVSLGSFATFALFALGWTLFGIATAVAGVFPRAAGAAAAIGGAVGFLGGFPPFQIPLALAVAWLSWRLVRHTTTAAGTVRSERRGEHPADPNTDKSSRTSPKR